MPASLDTETTDGMVLELLADAPEEGVPGDVLCDKLSIAIDVEYHVGCILPGVPVSQLHVSVSQYICSICTAVPFRLQRAVKYALILYIHAAQ